MVTQELLGWNEPSDAAASILAMCQEAAADGDSVTILWIPPFGAKNRLDAEQSAKLTAYFSVNYLIKLEILTGSPHLLPVFYSNEKASVAIYHYLKANPFDVVYFALEGGLGYYSLLGKETGLFEPRPRIYVLAHRPLVWEGEAEKFFLKNVPQVAIAHMEKYCASMADSIIFPTQYMCDWVKSKEWKLPPDVKILPDLRPHEWSTSGSEAPDKRAGVDEIVHIGGPDFSTGLTLLCDAMDHLAKSPPSRLTVTVAGRFGRLLGEHSGGMMLRRSRRWPFELKLLPKFTPHEILTYVRNRNCLVVLPYGAASYPLWVAACIEERIPFIATAVGGTPELLAGDSIKMLLCEAKGAAIAKRITAWFEKAPPIASPAHSAEAKKKLWREHFATSSKSARGMDRMAKAGGRSDLPFVSIIMAHHDRPEYLPQAVAALERQDYPNFEVIIVDDGSKLPESHALLDELEPRFKERGWRIIRQPNRYLGAARNAGVKISKGQRILFVDDDNALFDTAVSTFVKAMDHSEADICTAFSRIFHEPFIPPDDKFGYIHYYPLGGSLDLALIHNSFGDANGMIRREVFDKIGLQIEDYGYTAQDWEFYTRATLSGFKVRIIPEPQYWYRSSSQAMYRSSHWYDNRQPIVNLFRRFKFAGLDHFYHLVIADFVDVSETEGYHHNLNYSVSDERFLKLRKFEPNTNEALELLAEIAAAEGRPDTAVSLLAQSQKPDFQLRISEQLAVHSAAEMAIAISGGEFSSDVLVDHRKLRTLAVRSSELSDPEPTCFIEEPDRLYLSARGESISVAVLAAGCPPGTMSIRSAVFLDEAITVPTEFIVLSAPVYLDPVLAARQASKEPGEGSSGWCLNTRPYEPRDIQAVFSVPSAQPMNLILAVRVQGGHVTASTLGCFSYIVLKQAAAATARRPRIGAPATRQKARALTEGEMHAAKLINHYKSQHPLLQFSSKEEGLFLRPSAQGVVAVNMPWVFPPFARRVTGYVEIAHDDASHFEFAMALTRPGEDVIWIGETPDQCTAFSGWLRVEKKFELHTLTVEVREILRTHLSLNLAIRLPKGSHPIPSQTFWRKLILSWDG